MKRAALTIPVTSYLLALLGAGLWLQSCQAWGRPPARRAPAQAHETFKDLGHVLGRGTTQEDAREDAARKAQLKIEKFLVSNGSSLAVTPPLDFIRDKLLKGPGEHLTAEDTKVGGETVEGWSWPLVIERQDWNEMMFLDRHARAGRRMLWLAKLAAGLVALLGVVAGYIRLDDWTKGYYSGWLRLGAVGLLTLVGAGLWWLS